MQSYIILLALAIISPVVFIRLADGSNLMDIPNERSSHKTKTLRGAGIISVVIFLIGISLFQKPQWWLISGLLLGATAGFLDDRYSLRASIRAVLYGISTLLIFYQLHLIYNLSLTIQLVVLFTVSLGTVNAYNFMDGINGITLIYTTIFLITALVLSSLGYIDQQITSPIVFFLIALLPLFYLNLRVKALAFLGDVGSVFIGFFVVYLSGLIFLERLSLLPFVFLLVYGVDSVITIVQRLLKGQNIFQAHRMHLYQLLTNEGGHNHLKIALFYALVQLLINLLTVVALQYAIPDNLIALVMAVAAALFYVIYKFFYVLPSLEKVNIQ